MAFVVSKTKTSLRDIAMDLVSIVKKRGGSISNRSAVVSAFCSVLELMNKGLCNADVDGRDYFIRSSKVVEIEESKIDDSLVA